MHAFLLVHTLKVACILTVYVHVYTEILGIDDRCF